MDTSVVAFQQWLKPRGIALNSQCVVPRNPLDEPTHKNDFDPCDSGRALPFLHSRADSKSWRPCSTRALPSWTCAGLFAIRQTSGTRPFSQSHQPPSGPSKACVWAASEVASYLRRLPLVKSAQSAAWTFQERWISSRSAPNESQSLVHVIEKDGQPLPRDPASPIVSLGDCHLYMDGMADKGVSGDFTSHLAQKVGLPLNCLYRVAGGSMLILG